MNAPTDSHGLRPATPAAPGPMLSMDQVKARLSAPGLGFERIEAIPGSTYRDNSTLVVVSTRGMLHHRAAAAVYGMLGPMNQKKTVIHSAGDDLATAFDQTMQFVVQHPDLSRWRYVMTLADDVLPPPDAQVRLLESIEWGPYDAVSAVVHTSGEASLAQIYGDPQVYARTGHVDLRRRSVREALQGGNVCPVNGVGMACTLWRTSVFKELPRPWYVRGEVQFEPDWEAQARTRLRLCDLMVRSGRRMAVDMRVHAGRLDPATGMVW